MLGFNLNSLSKTCYLDFFPLIFKEMIIHPILEGIKGKKNEYEGLRNEFVSHRWYVSLGMRRKKFTIKFVLFKIQSMQKSLTKF